MGTAGRRPGIDDRVSVSLRLTARRYRAPIIDRIRYGIRSNVTIVGRRVALLDNCPSPVINDDVKCRRRKLT